ncbi:MAG: hypothetical protein MZV64_24685 [Ignavibacteriales bacterium]|nr:hypothetical protein [Ignavibacteriales bacterium]
MDSWPLDQVNLQEVLDSQFEFTPEFIRDGLGYSLRGFHTIEYLLFRDGNPRNTADLTQFYEKEVTRVQLLKCYWKIQKLFTTNGTMDSRDELKSSSSGSRYASQDQAVQEIIEGIREIADEVGNGKIGDPYTTKNVLSVESTS